MEKNGVVNINDYFNKALDYFNPGFYSRAKYLFKVVNDNDYMRKTEIYELYNKIQEMKNNPFRNEKKYKDLNDELIDKIDQLIMTPQKLIFIDEKNLKDNVILIKEIIKML